VNEERIVVVVPQVSLDGAPRTVGDLVFTTRQVFLARRTGSADLVRAVDLTGSPPAAQRRRKSSHRLRAQAIDKILAAADRRTRFEYRELESIVVNVGGLFSSPSVRLIPRHGGRVKLLGKRAALELLASSIPDLVGAGAPISLT
jgi:hypothetical protein